VGGGESTHFVLSTRDAEIQTVKDYCSRTNSGVMRMLCKSIGALGSAFGIEDLANKEWVELADFRSGLTVAHRLIS